MRSYKYLFDICMEIYERMYKEAEPSLDFYKALADGYCKKEGWFMKHYLHIDRQDEIINEVCKKYKCSKYEKRRISNEIWLGSSPCSVKR